MAQNSAYDLDFYAWAQDQARILRSGELAAADIENIAEEIESMGRSEKRELVNRLGVLLLHLLKWKFQPNLRGASWQASVTVQRFRLAEHLADNPSLKSKLEDAMASAYRGAVLDAIVETGLARTTFPAECPFKPAQALDNGFWPD